MIEWRSMTHHNIIIPPKLAQSIRDVHGEAGADWLTRLPEMLARWRVRWSLEILPPFPDLSYHYVTPARTTHVSLRNQGEDVVLKAGVPGDREFLQEAAALKLFAGRGIIKLLDADLDESVMVLELLLPGDALVQTPAGASPHHLDAFVTTAAGVLQNLWRPVPTGHEGLRDFASWTAGVGRLRQALDDSPYWSTRRTSTFSGVTVSELAERAEEVFAGADRWDHVLLHGDFHPGNILRSGDGWRAIDPKGVVGPPLYDIGNFLTSLSEATSPEPLLLRAASLLGQQLGFEPNQILTWSMAHAVLSGWWSYEDHGAGWEPSFAHAARMLKLLSL